MRNLRLEALSEHVQVITGPVNVGLIRIDDRRAALIDTGIEGTYGRHVLDLLRDNNYQLDTILITHAHADHIGGAACLQRETGCRILASPRETPAIRHPEIQAIALSGTAPLPELCNRFIMAEPARAEDLPEGGTVTLGGLEVQVIPLPGHSLDQVGYRVEGVCFVADTLFSPGFFKRHGLIFTYDPLQHLRTLDEMRRLAADWYVPGHLAPCRALEPLIGENIRQTRTALATLHGMLAAPKPPDRIYKELLGHYRMSRPGWEHFLHRATVRSLLSALKREGRADFRVMDNLVMWYATTPQGEESA